MLCRSSAAWAGAGDQRKVPVSRLSSGPLNNYILIALRESLEANLCLNKVKCHRLCGLQPKVGAGPHVACDTNFFSFLASY